MTDRRLIGDRSGVQRSGRERSEAGPERRSKFARRDAFRQVRYRNAHHEIHDNLDDERATMLQIAQSITVSVCAITLATGSAKPRRLRPNAIAAPTLLWRISSNSSPGVIKV
jgi:hypothetical protein